MRPSHWKQQLFARLAIVLGIWTVLAVVFTAQGYLLVYWAIHAQDDLPNYKPSLVLSELFLSSLAECLIWACLTFAIVWLARRFPFGQGKWLRSLAVHLAACLLCAAVAAVLSALAAEVIRKEYPRPSTTLNVL